MRWKDVSIAKKLYTVVGIMGVLIAGELIVLSFAMGKLSGVRAFVNGESLWSKAQKDAVIHLERFSVSNDERDYRAFLKSLEVPMGDRQARMELLKPEPDLEVVTRGFLQGNVPLADIRPMVDLIRRFHWVSYLSRAIEIWTNGDEMIGELQSAGERLRASMRAGDRAAADRAREDIEKLDLELTELEKGFSYTLGQGSRWVESVAFSALVLLVLTVESFGLGLTILTTRALSRGLKELGSAANEIGRGNFGRKVAIASGDELGKLAVSVNQMATLLDKSYGELERRVEERTQELSKLAEENGRLYAEARDAVKMRDEFLSIASHELKTPVSALQLELQLLSRMSRKGAPSEKVIELSSRATRSSKRLAALLDELLDLTRIRLGRLEVHRERGDLTAVVREVASAFSGEASAQRSSIRVDTPARLEASFDELRLVQVIGNLVSNALKYAPGTPVTIRLREENGHAVLQVEDRGPGIPAGQRERIFERHERNSSDPSVTGLGLGLYIARQLIDAHGGRIRVESGADGTGATFVVEFPLAGVSSAREPALG